MRNRGYSYRERVGLHASGRCLLGYLSERYPHSTETSWRRRIEEGRVRVDGRAVSPSRRLGLGETLVWNRPPWDEPEAPESFALLYLDASLLAVAKPRGLPTMPGGGFLERTLLGRVRRHYPEASPLHRLGRATSGIVLFARNRQARRALTDAWREGAVVRAYRALVEGDLSDKEIVIDHPIGRVPHPVLGSVAAADPRGKPARSRVRLLERRRKSSLIEVLIETGRTHQIRIHLAACGHPLAGDPLYPKGGVPSRSARALPGDPGYWLHAYRLRFPQPGRRRDKDLFCLPPPVLRAVGE